MEGTIQVHEDVAHTVNEPSNASKAWAVQSLLDDAFIPLQCC